MTVGRGPFKVLLWSQMHGDEPTATSALFDLFEYLYRHRAEDPAARILDALTLHAVPMLNPDGAEKFTRRNAQGIDVNRDAAAADAGGRRSESAAGPAQPATRVQPPQSEPADLGRPAAEARGDVALSVAYDEARTINEDGS